MTMDAGRLEAFSDGVLAIIITIMVLELRIPHGAALNGLWPLLPVFLSYVLSFVYLGIYWNNHHHMLHVTSRVSGAILWANLHLLFWLSLVPFVTGWMGENSFAPAPTRVSLQGVYSSTRSTNIRACCPQPFTLKAQSGRSMNACSLPDFRMPLHTT
jgi:uncharacterized membrane protein